MRKKFIIAAAVSLLAGCDQEPEPINWMTAPNDPQVKQYVFQQCVQNTAGPQRTVYNDWDEAIEACEAQSSRVSFYCPDGAKCLPSVPDRESVRAILPHPKGDDQ